MKKILLSIIIGLGLVLTSPTLLYAATGTLSCTVGANAPATVNCSGSGWTATGNVEITKKKSASCEASDSLGNCSTDGAGAISSCAGLSTIDSGADWYLYGTEDSCSTSTADNNNPHTVDYIMNTDDVISNIPALLVISIACGWILFAVRKGFNWIERMGRS